MTDERVLVETVVHAAPDRVWRALREPREVPRWFGWEDEGLEAEIREIFVDQVVADDDARVLGWADGDRIVLEPEDDGATRVRILRPPHGADFDGVLDPIDEGWITFAQQLRFALERHPDEDRRTVAALDVELGPTDDPLLARLGLRPVGADPVGETYELRLPDGVVRAEVFFQTDLQVGLAVSGDHEDDALLVVARTPPAVAPPDGRAMFLLSLYGVDDDALAAAERRWTAWWGSD